MIFDLVRDFAEVLAAMPGEHSRRRLLELLGEAIRRDIQFIARHRADYPQALFQCAWNSGWWYDCPEAAAHYEQADGKGDTALPWERPAALRVSECLRRWREGKETATPDFVWLRSERPPVLPLGTIYQMVFSGHEECCNQASFSPDGTRVASVSGDGTLRLWDAVTSEEVFRIDAHEPGKSCSLSWSPDGRRIASSSGKIVTIWEAGSDSPALQLEGHRDHVMDVHYSHDGLRLATASLDKTVRLWDALSGRELLRFDGHEDVVTCVRFAPDDLRLVSGSLDKTVRAWDVSTGQAWLRLEGHDDGVWSVSYSPDGKRIASGSGDNTVRIWDATKGKLLRCLTGHEGCVYAVGYSPDGRRLASGSSDATLRLWDTNDGRILSVSCRPQSLSGQILLGITGISWSVDGRHLVTGAAAAEFVGWDVDNNDQYARIVDHGEQINSVCSSPSGEKLATASDGVVMIWNGSNGLCERTLQRPASHGMYCHRIEWQVDDQIVIEGGRGETQIWDLTSDRCVPGETRPRVLDPGRLRSVYGFNRWLHFHSDPLWDVEMGERETTFRQAADPGLVAWIPESFYFLTVFDSRSICGAIGEHVSVITMVGVKRLGH